MAEKKVIDVAEKAAVIALSREAILDADDIRMELVAVPEWGGSVYVKSMSGRERDAFEASVVQQGSRVQTLDMSNIRAKITSLTICDENRRLIFSPTDIKALGAKSASALSRVFAVAQELSGITAEDMDDYTKDFEANPLDGSASD